MGSATDVDVSAILAAVYRNPAQKMDQVATRVRARLALLDTIGECGRLLFEAPAFAFLTTLGASAEDGETAPAPSERKG